MRLAALSFLSLLVACAPGSDPSSSSPGGKSDDAESGAACSADELETLGLCVTDGCPGLSGESLEICLQETCGEDLERVEDGCEACVLGGLEAGEALEEVAASCGAAAEAELCSADDLDWLFLCRDEGCPEADDLDTCLQETCGEEITSMPVACRGCFVEHSEQSASDIVAACSAAGDPGPEAACAGDDAELVELCLSEGCPGSVGEALEVCLQESCGEDLDRAADECKSCVFDNVNGGAAGVSDACMP